MARSEPPSLLTRGAKLLLGALQSTQTEDPTLVILTIRLLFRAGSAIVCFSLEGIGKFQSNAGSESSKQSFAVPWEIPYSALTADDDLSFEPPSSLVQDLKYRLQQVAISDDQPLWLRLVRPYGWLGTAPWECVFASALDRPVLRLPDSPLRPSERADVHQSALIVDPGMQADEDDVQRSVRAIAQAVVRGSSRSKTQVHIFATMRWYSVLQHLESAPRILVHKPSSVAPVGEESSSPALNAVTAWTDWVVERLDGQGLDAIHFFGRATHNESGGRIVATSDPGGAMEHAADVELDVAEFDMLMSRAGSWAATFIPALPRHWLALSYFADALARVRPCAVLCQPLSSADDQFFGGYRLLFDAKAQPAPVLTRGFLYCHPSFIAGTAGLAGPDLLRALSAHALVLASRAPLTERLLHSVTNALPGITATNLSAPPNWVGATQRFLESAVFDAMRRTSEDVLLSKSLPINEPSSPSLDAQSAKLLDEIQGVVDSYLKKTSGK